MRHQLNTYARGKYEYSKFQMNRIDFDFFFL